MLRASGLLFSHYRRARACPSPYEPRTVFYSCLLQNDSVLPTYRSNSGTLALQSGARCPFSLRSSKMFRQIFRNHRFILLLIGCGLLAIAGYKWLSNSQPAAPKKMSISTPNPREQVADKGDRFPESARTAPARKPPVATRSRYAPQRLSPPEIPAEKRQRISELYDRPSPDRDNVNRDADWATAGPPREEVDILAEGLDTLSAAKSLKALGGYNKYACEYADKALA